MWDNQCPVACLFCGLLVLMEVLVSFPFCGQMERLSAHHCGITDPTAGTRGTQEILRRGGGGGHCRGGVGGGGHCHNALQRRTGSASGQPEHRPGRPPSSKNPTQRSPATRRTSVDGNPTRHAEGRTGDCPGPRKETATRRNATHGGMQGMWESHRRDDRGDVGRARGVHVVHAACETFGTGMEGRARGALEGVFGAAAEDFGV